MILFYVSKEIIMQATGLNNEELDIKDENLNAVLEESLLSINLSDGIFIEYR